MGNATHTIELNGQLYDAVTGKMVNSSAKPAMAVRALDGIVRHAQPDPILPTRHAKLHRVAVQAPKPAAKPGKRSTTLMRTAVKKPAATSSRPDSPIVKKQSSVPAHRRHHSANVSKSQQISKFGSGNRAPLAVQVAALPVQAPPVAGKLPIMNLRQQIAAVTGQTGGARHNFEQALHGANSHTQPKVKKPKLSHRFAAKVHVAPRLIGLATGFVTALLIGGFFLYQNAPNLSMRVAATRAGVAATLPAYKPAGFSMSRDIQYAPGEVTVNFKSNSDERAFNLTQQKTALTPQEVADEIAGADNRPYQTYQDAGKTIYIYDGSSAAWTEEGVLYRIEGESALSSDQLIRLATSI